MHTQILFLAVINANNPLILLIFEMNFKGLFEYNLVDPNLFTKHSYYSLLFFAKRHDSLVRQIFYSV